MNRVIVIAEAGVNHNGDMTLAKALIDAAAKDDQLDIERERIASAERIAGLQVGAKIGGGKEALAAKQESEGLKMGVDIARDLTNRSQQQAPTNRAEKEPK